MNREEETNQIGCLENQKKEMSDQIELITSDTNYRKLVELDKQIETILDQARKATIAQLIDTNNPPLEIAQNLNGILILFRRDLSWKSFQKLSREYNFLSDLRNLNIFRLNYYFQLKFSVPEDIVQHLKEYMSQHEAAFQIDQIARYEYSDFNRIVCQYLKLTVTKFDEFKDMKSIVSQIESLKKQFSEKDDQIKQIYYRRERRIIFDYQKLVKNYQQGRLDLENLKEFEIKERSEYLNQQIDEIKNQIEKNMHTQIFKKNEVEKSIYMNKETLNIEFSRQDQAELSRLVNPHINIINLLECVLILLDSDQIDLKKARQMLKDQQLKSILMDYNLKDEINESKFNYVNSNYKAYIKSIPQICKAATGLAHWIENICQIYPALVRQEKQQEMVKELEQQYQQHTELQVLLRQQLK